MHRAFCSRILFVYMSCNLSAFLSLIMLVYKIYVKRWRNVFILPGSQRRRPQLATLMKIAQSQSQILCQTKERRTTQRTVNRRGMRASLTSVGRSAVYSVLKVRPKCLTRHCTHETVCLLCVAVSDVEVDVDELNQEQVMELNRMATPYGMAEGDFVR